MARGLLSVGIRQPSTEYDAAAILGRHVRLSGDVVDVEGESISEDFRRDAAWITSYCRMGA